MSDPSCHPAPSGDASSVLTQKDVFSVKLCQCSMSPKLDFTYCTTRCCTLLMHRSGKARQLLSRVQILTCVKLKSYNEELDLVWLLCLLCAYYVKNFLTLWHKIWVKRCYSFKWNNILNLNVKLHRILFTSFSSLEWKLMNLRVLIWITWINRNCCCQLISVMSEWWQICSKEMCLIQNERLRGVSYTRTWELLSRLDEL